MGDRSRAAELDLEQLDRIERKLDELLDRKRRGARAARKRATTVAERAAAAIRLVPDDVTRAAARKHLRRLQDRGR